MINTYSVAEAVSLNAWACPNSRCVYDKQLQSGQRCPLCGSQAREFTSSELGNLWKQKWDCKKSVEKARRQEEILATRKFCPKCGSANVNVPAFYSPSTWKCLDCGYEGAFILEDSGLAEKIHERFQKDKEA